MTNKLRCSAYNQPSHTQSLSLPHGSPYEIILIPSLIPYEISLTLPLWHQMPKRVGFMKLQGAKAVGELLNNIIIIFIIIIIIKGTGSLKTLLLLKLSVTVPLIILCCTVATSPFPLIGLSIYTSDILIQVLAVLLECKASDLLHDIHEIRSIGEGLVGGLGTLLNVMPQEICHTEPLLKPKANSDGWSMILN